MIDYCLKREHFCFNSVAQKSAKAGGSRGGGVSHVVSSTRQSAQVRNKNIFYICRAEKEKKKSAYVGGFSDEQTTNNVSELRRGKQKHTDGRLLGGAGGDCAESAPAAATNRGDPKSCA